MANVSMCGSLIVLACQTWVNISFIEFCTLLETNSNVKLPSSSSSTNCLFPLKLPSYSFLTLQKIPKKNLSFSRNERIFFSKWAFFSRNEHFFSSKRRIIRRFEKKNVHFERKKSSFSRKGQIFFSLFVAVQFIPLLSLEICFIWRDSVVRIDGTQMWYKLCMVKNWCLELDWTCNLSYQWPVYPD